MLYTCILDDSIRVRLWFWQLITRLSYFSQVFLQNKELLFSSVGEPLHDHGHICMTLPLLTAHFSWPLPFLSLKKLWPSVCFHQPPPPLPLLISDKSLICTKGIWRPRAQVNCCRSALTLAGLVLTEFIYSTKLVNDLVCFQPVGILIFYVFFPYQFFFCPYLWATMKTTMWLTTNCAIFHFYF